MEWRGALCFAIVLTAAAVTGQANYRLVADINQVAGGSFSSEPHSSTQPIGGIYAQGFLRCGSRWFFAASNAQGEELWVTDGTAAGTTMVKDIRKGPEDSGILSMVCLGSNVYFSADDGTHGRELWRSDGTAAGTALVKDLNPGSATSTPNWLTPMGSKVYFCADTGTAGAELYETDGTAAGTRILKDIAPGAASSSPSYIQVDAAGKRLLFQATTAVAGAELWTSDGTSAGTTMVKDIQPGSSGSIPTQFLNHGGVTFFVATTALHGKELWKTDGTAVRTSLVKDIHVGKGSSSPRLLGSYYGKLGNDLFFSATDGARGIEMFKTDGTAAGTTLVADIAPGSGSSSPSEFFAIGSTVFFVATAPGFGQELHKLSGGKVTLVYDIYRGSLGSNPRSFQSLGNRLVFQAQQTWQDTELWSTDGTPLGTNFIKDIRTGTNGSRPQDLTPISSTRLLLSADASTPTGRELWETDGTTAGTKLFKDLDPRRKNGSSNPGPFGCIDGHTILFSAHDGSSHGIYSHDGSTVRRLANIARANGQAAFISHWTGKRTLTLFSADDGTYGRELWTTDGTPAGTKLLKDIHVGSGASNPRAFVAMGDKVYFIATSNIVGTELFVSDGTPAGTTSVVDIRPGQAAGVTGIELVCFKDRLYFTAEDGKNGQEPWSSDGTAAGTRMLKNISAFSSSYPWGYVVCGDELVFGADDDKNGGELWATNGTAAGTRMVKDIRPGLWSSGPMDLMCFEGKVYFSADDGKSGVELWSSDLTAAGTKLVKDILPGAVRSQPKPEAVSRGKLFLTADDGTGGRELWASDGTTQGTTILSNLPYNGRPLFVTPASTGVLFASRVAGLGGTDLFVSDGTAAGTKRVCNLYPNLGGYFEPLVVCRGTIYLNAASDAYGVELHSISDPLATFERLGTGCGKTRPDFTSTTPLIGGTWELRGARCPTAGPRLLVIGVPTRPYTIPGLTAHDCAVWPNVSLPILLSPLPAGTSFRFQAPIPNSNGLLGADLSIQGVFGAPATDLSNGIRLRLGR